MPVCCLLVVEVQQGEYLYKILLRVHFYSNKGSKVSRIGVEKGALACTWWPPWGPTSASWTTCPSTSSTAGCLRLGALGITLICDQ